MFNSWLVSAFQYFIAQLSPINIQDGLHSLVSDYLGVWTPDLTALNAHGAWNWLMIGMTGLGVVIGLWFAIPVVIISMTAADVRGMAQALFGVMLAAGIGPSALWLAAQVRQPVIDTARSIITAAGLGPALASPTDVSSLLATIMTTIAAITYVVAGLIASYAFLFTVIMAPIAASMVAFRGGLNAAVKWATWFGTLLLAPLWASLGLAIAVMMQQISPPAEAPLALAIGVILAGLAPFTVLSTIARALPGTGAEGATRIGAGHHAASAAQSIALGLVR